ncbi:MAG: pyridoxamine 5'-phosphate oxidase family protein [Ignavibacteriae bacterium]|nr:pyridoxamine 5'-phosphate oxidase family protein [Ignavibacteriota bacterium]MCB9208006.1 pyridoxamine 5'-phosphate oxidase family protein [Ignavibacteriales bacterium]MCB9258775.1 pyridoxamine 5'-phosphate oxidase family protein [Ignavibacteriales bacterium]
MEFSKSEQNLVKRGAHKATYNKEEIYSILDSSLICTIAFKVDDKAFVQPINFGRKEDTLFVHGSLQNRMTNSLIESGEACINVFHLDSMKLTRSAFHHSVNFRSAVIFGKVRELKTNEEKIEGLKSIINHFVPGRWDHCRFPTDNELKATRVIVIDIETASAKIANSPPSDNKEDYDLDFWAGEIPIKTICENPIPDEKLNKEITMPQHVSEFYENRKNGF